MKRYVIKEVPHYDIYAYQVWDTDTDNLVGQFDWLYQAEELCEELNEEEDLQNDKHL